MFMSPTGLLPIHQPDELTVRGSPAGQIVTREWHTLCRRRHHARPPGVLLYVYGPSLDRLDFPIQYPGEHLSEKAGPDPHTRI